MAFALQSGDLISSPFLARVSASLRLAAHQTASPAGDPVSGSNFRQSTDVVQAMRKHNETLLVYAEHYVVKLKECRSQMATTEDGTETSMNQVH